MTQELDAILQRLLTEVGASRATIRIDDAGRGWEVAYVCAEALAPGVKSMRGDGSINQRGALTSQWLAANRRNLLQPDLLNAANPTAPAALLAVYGAKAQMLGPLLDGAGYLVGWISTHFCDGPKPLGQADSDAMDRARAEVARLVGIS
jgi:hypothetical protein